MNLATSDVVLITGASSGIGRACAVHLARRGFTVYATSRRDAADPCLELRAGLPPDVRLEACTLDVDDDASVRAAVGRILDTEGRIDAVVHCAGFGIGGAVEDAEDGEASRIVNTNVLGALRVCRAVLPAMRRQGTGRLLVITSIAGRIALPFQGLYSATKFALEGLCESLSMEVRSHGVRVVLIEPGDFRTGFTDRRVRAARAGEKSAYQAAFERTLAVVEADERGASTPEPIARLVERVLGARSPRLRYTIGPLPQRLAVHLKKVLPGRSFERVLSLYYRLPHSPRARTPEGQGGRRG
jgi:NAD(P)-dependent dehydrogenase (short-subunit alcohol dehydrogenase family)